MNMYDENIVERSKAVLTKLQKLPKATQLKFCCTFVRHARRVGMEVDEDMKARLIERALMEHETEAYALLILEKLDQKAYSEAKRLILDLTLFDWQELSLAWNLEWMASKSFNLGVGKNLDAAIICCLAACFFRPPLLKKADKYEMSVLIRSSRPDVVDFLDELRNE